MSAALARPLLHTVHLVTFAVLLVSGLLLLLPDLRAAVTGGYSLLIRDAHCWGGVAFAVLPVVIVAACGARAVFLPPNERTARTWWQAIHVAITVVMGGGFTLTGFLIWGTDLVPQSIVDASRLVHDWLTYAAAILVAVHLIDVGLAALITRIKSVTAATAPHAKT